MLSVMTPVKDCRPAATAKSTVATRPNRKGFITGLMVRFSALFARGHEVRGGGAGVHDPDATGLVVIRQAEGRCRRAGDGDGHMGAGMFLVRAHVVIPDRSKLGFHAGAIFFGSFE